MTTYTELRNPAESPFDEIRMHEGLLRRLTMHDDGAIDGGCGIRAVPHVSRLFS